MPWFAAFLRRARRLRPVFPIFVLLIQHVDLTCHTRGLTRSTNIMPNHVDSPKPECHHSARTVGWLGCSIVWVVISLSQVLEEHTALDASDRQWLEALTGEWQLLADTSFSDLVLWLPDCADENVFWAGAQIRPLTGPTALADDVVGDDVSYDPEALVTCAFLSREISATSDHRLMAGIPVDVMAVPVVRHGKVIAVVERHTNQMGLRAPGALEDTYLAVADVLTSMLHRGMFPLDPPSDPVSSPRVGDGMMWVAPDGMITFASPNVISALRGLELSGDIQGEKITSLAPELVDEFTRTVEAGNEGRSFKPVEVTVEGPQAAVRMRVISLDSDGVFVAALVLVRDVTTVRERERQLVNKDATIAEIHHRVKNNLQTVAALLRLQSRRLTNPEGKEALADAMRRVQSIAAVHEILSRGFDEDVDFDAIADRILVMVGDVAASSGRVSAIREGSFGMVPGEWATSLSLVMTELTQNAIEHGLAMGGGSVIVHVERHADGELLMQIIDDGAGLPEGFDPTKTSSLGLSIVTTLISDLGGSFALTNGAGHGAVATVRVGMPFHL
ncbi:hypothetical protein HMPREF1531_01976 [Propionibacterium sp. oral taxon 192 str. F0372]|nr:hypothetical protein HMPREF1531_01976 [Propionibacterium sp. oral taxon 192 str. F0372]